MSKPPPTLALALSTKEELSSALSGTPALLVLDVHQAWCGPSVVLDASLRKMTAEFGPTRLRVHSVGRGGAWTVLSTYEHATEREPRAAQWGEQAAHPQLHPLPSGRRGARPC